MEIRQQKILEAVIKEYVNNARPISSGFLVKNCNFKISPATIRAGMKQLEKEKYLYQPHTSAGRIPTDKGYRFFINSLMKTKELTGKEQKVLQQNVLNKIETTKLMPKVASLLAEMSSNLAISGLIDLNEPAFFKAGISRLLREPEFAYGSEIAEVLDFFDKNTEDLFNIIQDERIGIFIGEENPIKQIKGFSLIVSGHRLRSGERGLIAILGPRRMRYDRNIALVQYMGNLLENI